jgi:hypothetical protein
MTMKARKTKTAITKKMRKKLKKVTITIHNNRRPTTMTATTMETSSWIIRITNNRDCSRWQPLLFTSAARSLDKNATPK